MNNAATIAILCATGAAAHAASAEALAESRTRKADEERIETDAYVGFSALTLATGATLAFAEPSGTDGRAFGTWLGGWGAIDLALAVPELLDRSHHRAKITADRVLHADALAEARDDAIERDSASRRFALFVGLDVASITAGGLLWHYASGHTLRGLGMASVVEGIGLGVFDTIGLVLSSRRAARIRDLRVTVSPSGAAVGFRF